MKRKMNRTLALALVLVMTMALFAGFGSTASAANVKDFEIGDYVQIGKYQDAPILWRVIEIDDNGPLLLSDKIITVKDFNPPDPDAPDTGSWMKRTDGSNFWETSNLRAWLNSTETVMTWPLGIYPSRKETPGDVYYEPEPGFLHDNNFTSAERSLIKSVKQKQVLSDFEKNLDTYSGTSVEIWISSVSTLGKRGSAEHPWIYGVPLYEGQYAYDLTEKIFLLDVWQIDRLFANDNLKTDIGDSYIFAEYTNASGLKGHGAEGNFNGYGRWYGRTPLLRDQGGENINGVGILGVGNYSDWLKSVPMGFWSSESPSWSNMRCGVRPAFYLDASAARIPSGTGAKNNPYVIDGPQPAPNLSTASTWAQENINTAYAQGLIPSALQNTYSANATRAEFATLAVALYEVATGKQITERVTFGDTNDVNIEKAAAIGVVTGVGDNKFDPTGKLTREQAAVMLARLANAVGKPLPKQAATFADNAQVSTWATEAVGQVQAAEIMGGTGNNMFSPQGAYTKEQSITTILRLFNFVK